MKVLHVIDSGGMYGAEVMLLNLVAEQIRLGIEPVIVSIGEPGIQEKPLECQARAQGFALKTFRMSPGPNFIGAAKVLRFAWETSADLMHSHGYKGNILFGLIPRSIRKIPLISTLHGWTGTGGLNKMAAYEALDRLALRLIDAIVCVNEAMLDKPELKWLRLRHPHVVDNGLPCNGVHVNERQDVIKRVPADDAELFHRQFTIGTIGRLSREKGYDHLIMALRLVLESGIDANLVIIGEGNERQALEELAKRQGVLDRVHLIGYRSDARRYLPLFDVYTISSLTEGLPITLLEAMQARTPIVATRVGGIPNVLDNGRAGVLVDPALPRSLADGIIHVIQDCGLKEELVSNAYNRLVSNYSSRKMAEGYSNIYQRLCRKD